MKVKLRSIIPDDVIFGLEVVDELNPREV